MIEVTPPMPGWFRTLGPAAVAYLVATPLTGAHFWGDSVDYAESVLNGIAYDKQHDRLFVTGKQWPAIFEIKIIPVKNSH